MAFAPSIDRMEEAFKKDGCPICRLSQAAAIQSISAFLWEHANDSQAREPINKSYGLCPPHTRLLVASELNSTGSLPGVHMIYEVLARKASEDLNSAVNRQKKPSILDKLLKGKRNSGGEILKLTGCCPICEITLQSEHNYLSVLVEEITRKEVFLSAYQQSDGICMRHIRMGNLDFAHTFPHATATINRLAAENLQKHRADMLEYLRKQNWEYRDEKLTPAESIAWLKTLTFFTGYPADKFDHHIDLF